MAEKKKKGKCPLETRCPLRDTLIMGEKHKRRAADQRLSSVLISGSTSSKIRGDGGGAAHVVAVSFWVEARRSVTTFAGWW